MRPTCYTLPFQKVFRLFLHVRPSVQSPGLQNRFSPKLPSHLMAMELNMCINWRKLMSSTAGVPNLLDTRNQFHGRQFFHRPGQLGGRSEDDSSALRASSLPAVGLAPNTPCLLLVPGLRPRGWGPLLHSTDPSHLSYPSMKCTSLPIKVFSHALQYQFSLNKFHISIYSSIFYVLSVFWEGSFSPWSFLIIVLTKES